MDEKRKRKKYKGNKDVEKKNMPKGRGRPTDYRPEYCEKLVKHMSEGLSFECFAAQLNVCRDTLYEWGKKHKEFSDTKKIGLEKCLEFWEKLGRMGVIGKVPGFQQSTYIFTMKNRFGWRDVQDFQHSFDERVGKIKVEIVTNGQKKK